MRVVWRDLMFLRMFDNTTLVRCVSLIFFLFTATVSPSQNLVPNPSFENYPICPASYSYKATSWADGNTQGSYDLFHTCSTSPICDVPVNNLGQQMPFNGNGYAHIIVYNPGGTYREYLQVQLTAPLVAGQSYQVSFRWSKTENTRWSIDRIGIFFSASAPTYTGWQYYGFPGPELVLPSVQTTPGVMLTDQINWTLFQTVYVATGGERWLTLGNFYSDANSVGVESDPTAFYNYSSYYIDLVEVKPAVPLPVELVSFQGIAHDHFADLQWATASESNSNRFEVERSEDGIEFATIGAVPASGQSVDVRRYSFTDPMFEGPLAYYRLKQVDMDGSFTFSNAIVLTGTVSHELDIRQDNGLLQVSTGEERPFDLTIYALSGHAVAHWSAAAGVLRVDHGLKGLHILEVVTADGQRFHSKVFFR